MIGWLARLERLLAPLLLLLAVLLGAYTGFLLSALKTYPMLNNPILPALFLVSGISSGWPPPSCWRSPCFGRMATAAG